MRRRRRILRAAILSLASFLVGMLAIGIPLIYLKFIPTPDLLLVGSVSDTDILVAPSLTTHVRLIDHAGSVVHRWNLADPTTGMVELMPDGSLLYFASGEPGASGTPLGAAGQGLRRVSWDGELMWAYDDGRVHHDFELLPDGTVAVLRSEPMDPGLAARVQGGAPGTEFKGQMWADQVIEIDPTTNASRVVFDATKVLDPTGDALPEWMKREEWTHANSLAYTASDPISGQEAYLISFRAISTIAIVSRATGEIIWSYGGKWALDQQHDASFLPNGDVMVFDNGQYLLGQPSSSQVLEIDPRTNEIVWRFPDTRNAFSTLYSSIISGAQRLPNGNTLITYGIPGRLIEVTKDHDVVWDSTPAPGHFIFKARAYPTALVANR